MLSKSVILPIIYLKSAEEPIQLAGGKPGVLKSEHAPYAVEKTS